MALAHLDGVMFDSQIPLKQCSLFSSTKWIELNILMWFSLVQSLTLLKNSGVDLLNASKIEPDKGEVDNSGSDESSVSEEELDLYRTKKN